MYKACILSISYYSLSLPTTTTEINEYASCAYRTFNGVNILEKSAVITAKTVLVCWEKRNLEECCCSGI
jgi:hypothetical protein